MKIIPNGTQMLWTGFAGFSLNTAAYFLRSCSTAKRVTSRRRRRRRSDNRFGKGHAMKLDMMRKIIWGAVGGSLLPLTASATPSSTFWAPSTASCQSYGVPHITYDTYFAKGPSAGGAGAPNYPVDTGLTMGLLPFEKIQGEVGFDLLLPTEDPFLLNGKLCTPESSMFGGSPGVSFGIYNFGFKKDVTDYNVMHIMLQKTIPGIGGYISLGVYHGLNKTLLTNSDGNVVQSGFMAGFLSPEININLQGLKKINFTADVQTGKNVLGAWGGGLYLFFSDNISLLTGPVFFFDRNLQPGKKDYLWTAQIDVDIPLGASHHP